MKLCGIFICEVAHHKTKLRRVSCIVRKMAAVATTLVCDQRSFEK